MRRYGIDISAWQRNFDIAKARQDYGVEFVIIKAKVQQGLTPLLVPN